MFAFCRYIKVCDSALLIGALNKIWIGKLRLHANVARFGRDEAVKPTLASVQNVYSAANKDRLQSSNNKFTSYVNVAKASLNNGKRNTFVDGDNPHVLDIKQSVLNDLPLAILGGYKDFRSIANTRSLCR
ncbi:hypothetical protein Tco_0950244, partial [Tanacetum coccineum]